MFLLHFKETPFLFLFSEIRIDKFMEWPFKILICLWSGLSNLVLSPIEWFSEQSHSSPNKSQCVSYQPAFSLNNSFFFSFLVAVLLKSCLYILKENSLFGGSGLGPMCDWHCKPFKMYHVGLRGLNKSSRGVDRSEKHRFDIYYLSVVETAAICYHNLELESEVNSSIGSTTLLLADL